MTVKDANDFFSQKIIQSANRENISFDSLEKKMLYWSSEQEDPELEKKFAENHNDADYEKKVRDLLRKSYSYDREYDPEEIKKYTNAYRVLRQGDHYLLVMLNGSIGNKIIGPREPGEFLTNLKKINIKEVIKFNWQFLKIVGLGMDGKPQGKLGFLLRFLTGAISVSLLYLPVIALIKHGTHDFWNGAPDSDFLKILLSFGLIFGVICIRGKFSWKWLSPWWMK